MRFPALLFSLLLPVQLLAGAAAIDVVSYTARLTIDPSEKRIDARATITFRNVTHTDLHEITLDLRGMATDRVACEGVPLDFSASDSTLLITLGEALRSLDTTSLTVWYHGTPSYVYYEQGGVHFGPRSAWAHPQSAHERYVAMTPYWLPCNNVFSDKAIYDLTFDTPKGWRAASMGTLVSEESNGERLLTRWVLRDPVHTAGAGWAVGEYETFLDSIRGIPFVAYVWPEWRKYAEHHFRTIDSIVSVFEAHFGPYPGEKIGFVLTDSISVESHTMILLYKERMSANSAAFELEGHELAHHWFGNSVTPMDIRENWLSEGFAMYGEWLITAALSRIRTFDEILKYYTMYYRIVEAPYEGVLPLFDYMGAGAKYNYTSVIYIKGAIVLNMLRHWMGDERFRGGMHDYFARYRGQNVTSEMFRDVMEEHGEESLARYFDQWVYGIGWPMLRVTQLPASTGGGLRLGFTQTQQSEKGWPLFETPFDLEVVTSEGDTLLVRRMLHALPQEVIEIDEVSAADIVSWRIDPEGWLLHEAQTVTSVPALAPVATTASLESCYPHPLQRTGAQAIQTFSLRTAGVVQLELQDVLGRRLRVLSSGWRDAGRHALPLDLSGCAAGQYRLLLRTAEGVDSRLILVN
jgi:aminopeptidase N